MRYRVTYETTTVLFVDAEDMVEAAGIATQLVDEDCPGISFRIEMEEE